MTLQEVLTSGFAVVPYIRGAVLTVSFPSLAKTANTFVSGKLNVSLKEYQKNQLCRNIIARPTIKLGGDNFGIISTNWPYRDRQRLYFERLGHINSVKLPLTVIMATFYLTLIYTTLIIINN